MCVSTLRPWQLFKLGPQSVLEWVSEDGWAWEKRCRHGAGIRLSSICKNSWHSLSDIESGHCTCAKCVSYNPVETTVHILQTKISRLGKAQWLGEVHPRSVLRCLLAGKAVLWEGLGLLWFSLDAGVWIRGLALASDLYSMNVCTFHFKTGSHWTAKVGFELTFSPGRPQA